MLRVGDTLVPFIIMFDRAHPANIAGDLIEWLVYMTIRNLSLKIRQMLPTPTIIMVTLLPILIKIRNISQKRLDEER